VDNKFFTKTEGNFKFLYVRSDLVPGMIYL